MGKLTFSHLELCENFGVKNPFATAFFAKNETSNSLFVSASMQTRLYNFGLVLRGYEVHIKNLWRMTDEEAKEALTELFKDQPTDGINAYDITLLEVTGDVYKSVKFGENTLETFHRAFIGSREECLADLKRQFENDKDDWELEKA